MTVANMLIAQLASAELDWSLIRTLSRMLHKARSFECSTEVEYKTQNNAQNAVNRTDYQFFVSLMLRVNTDNIFVA